MTRKKADPSASLARFMFGIYDYFHDRGVPQNTAKNKMIDNTLEVVVKTIKEEQEIPDHMLVTMAQHMSRTLNTRGAQITKEIKKHQDQGTYHEKMLQPLHDIKPTKDAIDTFIETYKGWSELDGEKDRT